MEDAPHLPSSHAGTVPSQAPGLGRKWATKSPPHTHTPPAAAVGRGPPPQRGFQTAAGRGPRGAPRGVGPERAGRSRGRTERPHSGRFPARRSHRLPGEEGRAGWGGAQTGSAEAVGARAGGSGRLGVATHPGRRRAAPRPRRAAGPAGPRSPAAAAARGALRPRPPAAVARAASLERPDPVGAAPGHSLREERWGAAGGGAQVCGERAGRPPGLAACG